MKYTNIKLTSNWIKVTPNLKVKYTKNVTITTRNYSKIRDNNIQELVPEVEIGKDILIISCILYLASTFLIRLAVKAPKLLQ